MTLLEIFSYTMGFLAMFVMAWSCIWCDGANPSKPWNKGDSDD